MNRIDWQPGTYGKGIVDEGGGVHAWDEKEYPYHSLYERSFPEVGRPQAYFYIARDGEISITHPSPNPAYGDSGNHNPMMDQILKSDPHFHAANPSDWKF